MGYMHGKLVDVNGNIVNVGDKATSFRGELATVQGWTKPVHNPNSTGRVHVQWHDGLTGSYYPSVFDCKIVD